MCEVWYAIGCRIGRKLRSHTDGCLRLSGRLGLMLGAMLPSSEPDDSVIDDLNRWALHKDGSLLAAWVDLLVTASREAMNKVQAPERLRTALAVMAATASERLSSEAPGPDAKRLIARASQRDRDSEWNPYAARFCWANGMED